MISVEAIALAVVGEAEEGQVQVKQEVLPLKILEQLL